MPEHPQNAGHRQRLRSRFLKGGPDALADYELLELLLFAALPRGDTKPLAKALIERFETFEAAVTAEPERLAAVKGMGEAAIAAVKLAEAAGVRLARARIMNRPVLGSWQAVLDYCQAAMSHQKIEAFRVLFLDRQNRLIHDEVQQRGTVDHTPAYPREIVKRALEVGATALIMVHNHPSGDPTPSQADIEMTRQVVEAAKALRITVHDHLVIGGDSHASFRTLGLLSE